MFGGCEVMPLGGHFWVSAGHFWVRFAVVWVVFLRPDFIGDFGDFPIKSEGFSSSKIPR